MAKSLGNGIVNMKRSLIMKKKMITFSLTVLITMIASSCGASSQLPESSTYSERLAESSVSVSIPEESVNGTSEQAIDADEMIIEFTNAARSIPPISLEVGDEFLGLTLQLLETDTEAHSLTYMEAIFQGEITIKGTLTVLDETVPLFPGYASFFIADESFELVPFWTEDSRTVWLTFNNNDEVLQALKDIPYPVECEIVIDQYRICYTLAYWENSATFIALKDIDVEHS